MQPFITSPSQRKHLQNEIYGERSHFSLQWGVVNGEEMGGQPRLFIIAPCPESLVNGSTKGAFEMLKAGSDYLGSAGVQAGPGAAWVGRGVPLDLGAGGRGNPLSFHGGFSGLFCGFKMGKG